MTGLFFEDLELGQSAEIVRVVSAADVDAFAALSGDNNPVHLDDDFAKGGRIIHGMMAAAMISAVVGGKLPGPGAVYLNQSLRFRLPIKVGSEVTARVTVTALDPAKGRVTLATACLVNGRAVVDGEAMVAAPRRGEARP